MKADLAKIHHGDELPQQMSNMQIEDPALEKQQSAEDKRKEMTKRLIKTKD